LLSRLGWFRKDAKIHFTAVDDQEDMATLNILQRTASEAGNINWLLPLNFVILTFHIQVLTPHISKLRILGGTVTVSKTCKTRKLKFYSSCILGSGSLTKFLAINGPKIKS
jgi:hypothetical protein